MRLFSCLSAALLCCASAATPEWDDDLGKILADDAQFKGIKFFWIREHAKATMAQGPAMPQDKLFAKLLGLITNYAEDINAGHLTTSESAKILHGMLLYKHSTEGKKLYTRAVQLIRASNMVKRVPFDFDRCQRMGDRANSRADADPELGYRICAANANLTYTSFSVPEVDAMGDEVVYTVYLKHALAQHGLDGQLLDKCPPPAGNDRTANNWFQHKKYDDYLLDAVAQAAASLRCGHKISSELSVKVYKMVKDADDKTLKALNIAFIKEHPQDTEATTTLGGLPKAWTRKKCATKALEWFVGKLVTAEADGCGTTVVPVADSVPPTLEDILSIKTFSEEQVDAHGAPWATVILGGCVGASATLGVFSMWKRRSVTIEE